MATASTSELISLLKSEKENMELVNSNLIRVLEKKEQEIVHRMIDGVRTQCIRNWRA